jgi:hypothetical protein
MGMGPMAANSRKTPPAPSFKKELKLSGLGLTRERRVLAQLIRAACKPDPFKRPAPEPTLSGAKWAQSANMWWRWEHNERPQVQDRPVGELSQP